MQNAPSVPSCWRYLAEGNAHAVFYHAPDETGVECTDPRHEGHVLRIAKVHSNAPSSDEAPVSERANPSLQAQIFPSSPQDLMRTFLGSAYLPLPTLLPATPHVAALVTSLAAQSAPLAQRGRWLNKPLHLDPTRASLLLDYTHARLPSGPMEEISPTISVELKPKCGFLLTSPCGGPFDSPKRHVSRYQLHQLLKESQGKIRGGRSAYDPVKFFRAVLQEDRGGLTVQLKNLFEVPQNNLTVFCGHHRVYGAEMDTTKAAGGQAEALQRALGSAGIVGGVGQLIELLADVLLHPDQVQLLRRILQLQQLDAFDVEGAATALQRATAIAQATDDGDQSSGGPPASIEELQGRLDRIRCEVEGSDASRQPAIDHAAALASLDALPLPDCLDIVRGFLFAVAAKDCSLMITLQRQGGGWRSRVFVADLEIKDVRKMGYWLGLDRDIVACWAARQRTPGAEHLA